MDPTDANHQACNALFIGIPWLDQGRALYPSDIFEQVVTLRHSR